MATTFTDGSGALSIKINNADTPYTITSAAVGADVDRKIVISADTSSSAITINLPAIDEEGFDITVKDVGYNASTNNITLARDGSDTIEEGTSFIVNQDGQSNHLISNDSDSNWEVMEYSPAAYPVTGDGDELVTTEKATNDGDTGYIKVFYHDSASPAQHDWLAQISMEGNNDSAAQTSYARITGIIESPAAGSEQGIIMLQTADGAGGDLDDEAGVCGGLIATSTGANWFLGDGFIGGSADAVTLTTSGGTLTLGNNNAEVIKYKGLLVPSNFTTYSAAGAVAPSDRFALITSNSTGMAMTLANGSQPGQLLTLSYDGENAGADTVIITPTSFRDGSTITLTDVHDTAVLFWTSTGWKVESTRGNTAIA